MLTTSKRPTPCTTRTTPPCLLAYPQGYNLQTLSSKLRTPNPPNSNQTPPPSNLCQDNFVLGYTSHPSSRPSASSRGASSYASLLDIEMAAIQPNAFFSTQKSDSGLEVALHPLVLLTISDYITRHTLRNQTGPIIGALLGQQNGREVTVEHAFECKVLDGSIDPDWFMNRLQQSTWFDNPSITSIRRSPNNW